MTTKSSHLTFPGEASRILAEAKRLDEIKSLRDKAEAARAFIKTAHFSLELQNHAVEIRLRAERKAGVLLCTLKLRGDARKSKGWYAPPKLETLGITRYQSRRWQRLATVSEAEFTKYLRELSARNQEITTAGLLRIASQRVERSPTAQSQQTAQL